MIGPYCDRCISDDGVERQRATHLDNGSQLRAPRVVRHSLVGDCARGIIGGETANGSHLLNTIHRMRLFHVTCSYCYLLYAYAFELRHYLYRTRRKPGPVFMMLLPVQIISCGHFTPSLEVQYVFVDAIRSHWASGIAISSVKILPTTIKILLPTMARTLEVGAIVRRIEMTKGYFKKCSQRYRDESL